MNLDLKQPCHANGVLLQDDSSDSDTSSSEYESSEADEEAQSLSSSAVVKSDLFVTGEFSP